jgi:hypothetical protein
MLQVTVSPVQNSAGLTFEEAMSSLSTPFSRSTDAVFAVSGGIIEHLRETLSNSTIPGEAPRVALRFVNSC